MSQPALPGAALAALLRAINMAALISAAMCFLAACTTLDEGPELAPTAGFQPLLLHTPPFQLHALGKGRPGADGLLHVYIEGDGAAWLSPYHPPRDPTPLHSLALALARRDSAATVYLGRPCQYLSAQALAGCGMEYWTLRRFAPEVVATYGAALDQLKQATGARGLVLVGHSGGGTLAALLAARRDDVVKLFTVAAPLDLAAWTAATGQTPLAGSLDPGQDRGSLATATHWAGSADRIVPAPTNQAFVARRGGRLIVVPGFDHQCCWAERWPALIAEEMP